MRNKFPITRYTTPELILQTRTGKFHKNQNFIKKIIDVTIDNETH